MRMAEQVDDRIYLARLVLIHADEVQGAGRRRIVGARQPRGIDEHEPGQSLRRPEDLEPLDVARPQITQDDLEATVSMEPDRALLSVAEPGPDVIGDARPVPRHDARAFAGVRRRQPLAHERIQQGRLACLGTTHDRDAQRFVQPFP